MVAIVGRVRWPWKGAAGEAVKNFQRLRDGIDATVMTNALLRHPQLWNAVATGHQADNRSPRRV